MESYSSKKNDTSEHFLSRGGEMGALMRAKDWTKTSVGAPGNWPQSLRTVLSIILNSSLPMFLWWGPELICFYNDAYRPSLGKNGKHPDILGQPAERAWTEIWHIIKPWIDQVLNNGEAIWKEDLLVPIYRNGNIEDVYWTFCYSPVTNESGEIAGVLVTCTETTDKIVAINKIQESEQNFRNLVNQSPFPAATFRGRDLIIELANEEALILWRKDKSVIGKPLAEALPELKGQPYIKILEDVYNTGVIYEGNENVVWLEKDGQPEKLYVTFIYKALRNADETIYGILTTGMDVTVQVEARNKIQEAEERTRMALDAGMLGTFDLNIVTDKIICSKRMSEIFGFTTTNISHAQVIEAIHPDDMPVRQAANKIAAQTGSIHYEVRLIWPDKSIHWVSIQGKLSYDEKKLPVRIIGTVSDITEQKTFSQELEKKVLERTHDLQLANRSLEKMNQELASFAYVSSHDLQEPLRKIQTFALRIIETDGQNLSEPGKDYFQRMRKAAGRMQLLIEDLLRYSRTNTTEKIFKATDLNKLLLEVANDLGCSDMLLTRSRLPTIAVIPYQFSQLLTNILANAVKFARPDIPVQIVIDYDIVNAEQLSVKQAQPVEAYAHISITDNGIGFEPKYRERIFEVFHRLHGKDEYTGTGIGLAICKRIVENHFGLIIAEGKPELGATFHIYIPFGLPL